MQSDMLPNLGEEEINFSSKPQWMDPMTLY